MTKNEKWNAYNNIIKRIDIVSSKFLAAMFIALITNMIWPASSGVIFIVTLIACLVSVIYMILYMYELIVTIRGEINKLEMEIETNE